MTDQVSESVKLVYPLRLVLKVAGITSAAWYRKPKHGKEKARRGPRVVITDQALLDEVREEITRGHFIDEGYKKTWKRLKRRGIKVSKARVYRVMRANNLLSVTRPKPGRKVNEHKGNIKTDLPNRMWGTDGKRFFTRQDGYVRWRMHSLALDGFLQPLSLCLCLVDGAPQRIVNNFLE
ncbi:MAG: IS3 family transposase [Prolixibacteraceae bacterium]|jgi:hypothetical protein|nr:IS3 family transposase [Prolixibacteraceae bacterium]